MRRSKSLLAVLVLLAWAAAGPATALEIPVYPGAKRATQDQCCDFVTSDPLGKVSAFYSARFGRGPMDGKAFRRRYPEIARSMEQAPIPDGPGMTGARNKTFGDLEKVLWVLEERDVGGRTYPTVMFIAIVTPEGTAFSIPEASMPPDAMREFRRANHVRNPEEREFDSWAQAHPRVNSGRYGVPAYPSANVFFEDYLALNCFEVLLATSDPIEKVLAWYERAAATGFRRAEQGQAIEWRDWNFGGDHPKADRHSKFVRKSNHLAWYGRPGTVNRLISVRQLRAGDQRALELSLWRETGSGTEQVPAATEITLVAEVVGSGCVKERPPANIRPGPPPEPPYFIRYRELGTAQDHESVDED